MVFWQGPTPCPGTKQYPMVNNFKKFVWVGKGYCLAEFADHHHEMQKRKEGEHRVFKKKNRGYYDVFIYGYDA